MHTRGKPLGQDIDLERVARHAAGLTGADLANLANEAAILAGRSKRDFIAQADFENAFERVIAGLQSRKVITDQEKRVVAWHEAGHALVSELLPTVDKVQKVSIVPRGKALGYTLNLPQEDRYLKSRQELIDYMKVLLAGPGLRADHLRPGHHRRLRRPQPRDGDRPLDGPRVRDGHRDPLAPGPRRRLHGLRGAAPDRATRRCRRSPRRPTAAPTELLVDHRDLLDEIAERLLRNEVIERDEIREILAADRDIDPAPASELGRAARRDPGRGAGQQAAARSHRTAARRLPARCSG